MKLFTRDFNRNSSYFTAILFYFVCGLLLLLLPNLAQMSVDLKRIGDSHWWVTLIGALLSFVLGALAITSPAFIASILTQFVGVSLLVEGVVDLVSFLTINRKIKEFRKAIEKATVEL